tara:strand:- start:300 stop:638 length:339 start_codon:yes stop_codon:yes gene_type:complete
VLVGQQCLSLVAHLQDHLVLEMLGPMGVIHVFLLSLLQQSVAVKLGLEIMDLIHQPLQCLKVVHQVDQVVDKQLGMAHLLDLEQRIKVMMVDHHQVLLPQETEVVVAVEPEV